MKFLTIGLLFLIVLSSGCKTPRQKSLLYPDAIDYQKEGRFAQQNNDWDAAISYYKKASYIEPYNVKILNDLGIAYEQKNWYKKAEETYKKAITIERNFLPSYTNLARLYEKMGDIENAIKCYRLRITLSKDKDDPWVWKARNKILYYEEQNAKDNE